jgi:NADH-quinone oxidoreductase subunit M
MYQRTMHGPLLERNAGMRDLSWREAAAVIPMIALILGLGFFPKPALDVLNPTVNGLMQHVGKQDPTPTVASGTEGTDQ